jgi:hypothetical protein
MLGWLLNSRWRSRTTPLQDGLGPRPYAPSTYDRGAAGALDDLLVEGDGRELGVRGGRCR